MAIDQLGVVDAQAVEDRGVDVVDVQAVFDGVEADLVGPADPVPALTPPPAIHMVKP